jgi:hypothetical protein
LGLEDSEELSLYLELIRIIEKETDEIKAGDTRSGWTSWAMLGGIAAALLLLFGETRKLQSFPTQEVETIGLGGLFLYNIAVLSLRVLYPNETFVKPGRIRWSNDAYFSFIPSAIYSLLLIFGTIVVAIALPFPILTKSIIVAASTLWALLTGLLLVLSKIRFPFGNNRVSRKSGLVISLVTLLFSILALGVLATPMKMPIGEAATLPYILAGLILSITLLIGNLIHTMAPSRLLSSLQDLRNDIVFLRVEIDEALRRYETLKEGETLPDALQKDLSEIVNDLNVIEYAHSNMGILLHKLAQELPVKDDSDDVRQQKVTQFALDKDSYALHDGKCAEVLNALGAKLQSLSKRQVQLASVTEDWASENTIRSLLAQRVKRIEEAQAELNQSIQTVVYYSNNPDKIPQEMKAIVDTAAPKETK